MIEQVSWLNREFTFNLPIGVFPSLLERLQGTPARAMDLVTGSSEETLATRVAGKWSVKEHLGHLIDLQRLDDQRLQEFLHRVAVLSAADLQNRATEEANHRSAPIATILTRLRAGRKQMVRQLEVLTEEQVGITALHPRLRKPMRLLDWVYFIAEHDDHHLALARMVMAKMQNQHNPEEG